MAFSAFPGQQQVVDLLQRSLGRGRLAHAYLFNGHQISELEALARTLAKTLNCLQPVKSAPDGPATDCCDVCASCRKIDGYTHADIHWVRPESKSRIITVDQMRDLMREMHLKPNEAQYKVAVIVAADRMGPQAANAFLKTLEEPPPRSILILLTTAPERILETIISRCLRLNFAGESGWRPSPAQMEWLAVFSEMAAQEQKSLMSRYRLLGTLQKKLGEMRAEVEKVLTARSPLERYDEVDADLRERWEDELAAAIEAEYRLQRSDVLAAVEWWLRDVWLRKMSLDGGLLSFPNLPGTARVATRVSASQALENLGVLERTQRLLTSNVQEALALEVGLLKLNL
jgi:DNA polymerase III subunit delta'